MGNTDYMNEYPARSNAPVELLPRSKASGIATIVFGCIEFIFLVVAMTFAAKYAASFWWLPLLTAIGMIVTGALATSAAVRKNHSVCVAAIVMASLNLAWVCVKVLILIVALIGLSAVTQVEQQMDVNDQASGLAKEAVQTAMTAIWVAFAIYGIETISTFICLIVIITTVSKVVCCRPSGGDQVAIVVREVPPAVTVVQHPPPMYTAYPNQI